MIKRLLGMKPKTEVDGSFSPSPFVLRQATVSKTDYDSTVYQHPCHGEDLRILMVCTEECHMEMTNGLKFFSGNHPVETLVPMLHLQSAGFGIDIVTPTGDAVKLEMWAFPHEDEAVKGIYEQYREKFESPDSLQNLAKDPNGAASSYFGIFIPGGHGAMLGLPKNRDLGQLLHSFSQKNRFVMALCHGPAALLAASQIETPGNEFLYGGYEMVVFPDFMDKLNPIYGYLPGKLPWYVGKALARFGVKIMNKYKYGAVYQDRRLITGDGPNVANEFGKMAAKALLSDVNY